MLSFFSRSRKSRGKTSDSSRCRGSLRSRFEQLEPRALMAVDAILHWNDISLQAEANDKSGTFGSPDAMGPTGASRALAMVHVAMFDAINSVLGKYEPYLVQVVGVQGANIDAAVGQAAHDVLVNVYSKQATFFDAELDSWLADIPNNRAERIGIALGQTVAAAVIDARAHDGSQDMMSYTFTDAPGHYQVDPLHPNQSVLSPDWGKVTPFGMDTVQHFTIPPPPALDSPEYAAAFNEVKNFGGDGVNTPTERTPEETEIGLFWAYDGTKGLGTPPRLYNQIARTLAVQEHNTEYQNARMFALINVAMADAGIACWNEKYVYDLWRPVTGIRNADQDGNAATEADPNWTPLGAPASNQSGTNFTPPFPSYASGHATFGAALFETLTKFYGRDNITFTFTSDELNGVTTDAEGNVRPLEPRTFTSFSQAAEENGQSRIYLGIHWAFDKTAGIACGDKIADYIFGHDMQPLRRALIVGNVHTMQTAYFMGLRDMWFLGQQDGIHRKVAKINPIVFHT